MVVEFVDVYKLVGIGIAAGFLFGTTPFLIGFVINKIFALIQK